MKTASENFRTAVDDDSLQWDELLNVRTTVIILGEATDPAAPVIAPINVFPGPGDRLRGRHVHDCDAINLVLEGSMYMDGEWLRAGQMKVVPAGTEYGDALVGPEGCKFLEIFATQLGAIPRFADPEDQAYYEKLQGRRERARLGLTR